jgi:hypothetical protein
MYKIYNFKPKFLSEESKQPLSLVAEKIVPFLIIAATFVWLWR